MTLQSGKKQFAWNIVKCAVFVLLLFYFISALSDLFLPKNSGVNNKLKTYLACGFYGEPNDTLDVIGIGNSDMASGFSPMELWNQDGYTAYSCGEPSQNIFEAYNILSEVYTCQKPKVVILEVDGIFPTKKDSPGKLARQALGNMFPIFEYHDLWKTIDPTDIANIALNTWTSPTKGYRVSTLIVSSSRKKHKPHNPAFDRLGGVNLTELNRFRELCEQNGSNLLLVYIPTAFSWDEARHDAVAQYARENDLPFLDFNAGIDGFKLDWQTDTRDGGEHMNYFGARKVTLFIGDYLSQHDCLPDHRNDSNYRSWNTDYKKYQELV